MSQSGIPVNVISSSYASVVRDGSSALHKLASSIPSSEERQSIKMTRTDLEEQILTYLMNLGYSGTAVKTDERTEYGQAIDFVVYDHDQPYVVVETKTSKLFSDTTDSNILRFDPYVRQIQSKALAVEAPYYLLTNGTAFWWFETDSSGRPQLLDSPVRPTVDPANLPALSKKAVVRVLSELRDLFVRRDWTNQSDGAALTIYAKLLSERGEGLLRKSLLEAELRLDPLPQFPFMVESWVERLVLNRELVASAFGILDRMSLTDTQPQDLLAALDEVFIEKATRGREPRVPRWITDLLVRLNRVQEHDIVLDMYSNYGDALAAVSMVSNNNHRITTLCICPTSINALWTDIQRLVLNAPKPETLIGNVLRYDKRARHQFLAPTCVIVAPPFGILLNTRDESSSSSGKGNQLSEDVYLDLAIEWVQAKGRVVIIVPDSLLAGTNRRELRSSILERANLIGVISLGRFLPGSSARGSIVILSKDPVASRPDVFMATIRETERYQNFDSRLIPHVSHVLHSFQRWMEMKEIPSGEKVWITSASKMTTDNLTVDRYLPTTLTWSGDIEEYPMIPLRELASIKRGSRFKLDDTGTLPVIGPAAIRPMMLMLDSLDRTSTTNLRNASTAVQAQDIVLNAISTYRGAATVTGPVAEGMLISSHVIRIRPDTSRVSPIFLAAALNSDYVKPQLRQLSTGYILPEITVRQLENVLVPVPTLAVQESIVAPIIQARSALTSVQYELRLAEEKWNQTIRRLSAPGGKE